MMKTKGPKKCSNCRKKGHFASDCRQRNSGGGKNVDKKTGRDARMCFRCGKTGHIAKDCKSDKKNEDYDSPTITMLAPASSLMIVQNEKKCDQWMVDSARTCHISKP